MAAVAPTRRLPVGVSAPVFPAEHFHGASVAVQTGSGLASEREAQGILSLRGKMHTVQVRRRAWTSVRAPARSAL